MMVSGIPLIFVPASFAFSDFRSLFAFFFSYSFFLFSGVLCFSFFDVCHCTFTFCFCARCSLVRSPDGLLSWEGREAKRFGRRWNNEKERWRRQMENWNKEIDEESGDWRKRRSWIREVQRRWGPEDGWDLAGGDDGVHRQRYKIVARTDCLGIQQTKMIIWCGPTLLVWDAVSNDLSEWCWCVKGAFTFKPDYFCGAGVVWSLVWKWSSCVDFLFEFFALAVLVECCVFSTSFSFHFSFSLLVWSGSESILLLLHACEFACVLSGSTKF